MSKAVREQLIQINLEKIKEAVKNNRAVFIERQENRKTLYDYSLTTLDVCRVILELTVNDYHKGPEDDHDGSDGYVWVFLHSISGNRIYIKVKLFLVEGESHVKILSFHE